MMATTNRACLLTASGWDGVWRYARPTFPGFTEVVLDGLPHARSRWGAGEAHHIVLDRWPGRTTIGRCNGKVPTDSRFKAGTSPPTDLLVPTVLGRLRSAQAPEARPSCAPNAAADRPLPGCRQVAVLGGHVFAV